MGVVSLYIHRCSLAFTDFYMILYHGSEKEIKKPYYRGSRPHNDYGYGFYCTQYPDLAREWAVSDDHEGFINCYYFDDTGLSVLNLNTYPILTWLSILLINRTFVIETPLAAAAKEYIISEFGIDYEKYDVIKGYRADDSYFSFAQDFINNTISVAQLNNAMHLGDLGDQIVLKSEKAFSKISFDTAEHVPFEPWLSKKNERDKRARDAYFAIDKDSYVPGGIYVVNIIDEGIKTHDPRIR